MDYNRTLVEVNLLCKAVQYCHTNSVLFICIRVSFIAALPCIHVCSVLYKLYADFDVL